MAKIQKITGKMIRVCELGKDSQTERLMIVEGKIKNDNGRYYFRSAEEEWEEAHVGDFLKIEDGNLYHIKPFVSNYKVIDTYQGVYQEIPRVYECWFYGEEVNEVVQFAVDHNYIELNSEDPEHFFNTYVFGDWLTAPRTAALVFNEVIRNSIGVVTGIDFKFVPASEMNNYRVIIE